MRADSETSPRRPHRLGVREAAANDIAQELFISVHHALPDFEDADRSAPSKVRP